MATRAVAARERKRLEAFVRDSGIASRPRPWVSRAGNAAVAAVAERGEALTSEIVEPTGPPTSSAALLPTLDPTTTGGRSATGS